MTITATRRSVRGPLLVGFLWGVTLSLVALVAFLLINPFAAHGNTAVAESFGVTIRWYDAADLICPNSAGLDDIGCFHPTEPNVINVQRGLSPEQEAHTILHEIGHVLQNRLGNPADECLADRFAQSMGSRLGYYCPLE